jgi:hypothetical protein
MGKKLGAKIAGAVSKLGIKTNAGHVKLGAKWVVSKAADAANKAIDKHF